MLNRRPQHGATLIEILVSILVISFGILAMAAVQSNSVKFQKTSEYRATATMLAADIADRMRANKQGAIASSNNATSGYSAQNVATYTPIAANTVGTAANCGTLSSGVLSPCTAGQIATNDLVEWRQRLRLSLPGAGAHIAPYDASRQAIDLWIAWLDPREADSSNAANSIAPNSAECPPAAIWTAGTNRPHCLYLRVAL